MATQKLYKNGNALVISIPKQYQEELNLSEGSPIQLDKAGDKLIISPQVKNVTATVDAKFAREVEEFMNEHADVLKELANR